MPQPLPPLAIDRRSPVPLHAQVEGLLRGLLADPRYRHGTPLPAEMALSEKLGVSRNTVRQAMGRLAQEGLLIRRRSRGTHAAPPPILTDLEVWDSFSQEMQSKGVAWESLATRAAKVPATAAAAAALGIPPKQEVLRLERLRGMAGAPLVLFASHFHPRLGLRPDEDFGRPLYKLLEEGHGCVVATSREEIGAIPARGRLARVLGLAPGSPVLLRERQVADTAGRPVEYCRCYYRADRFRYRIEIRRRGA